MAYVEAVNSDEVKGWVETVTSLGPEEIRGGVERAEVPLNFTLPDGVKPKKMFLDITVSGAADKWRVFLGEFSVTKVFKPVMQKEYKGELLSKFVFDVTPISHIVVSDPTLRVINESSSSLRLLQSSLFVFYEYPELGELRYSYYVTLEPHKSFWGPLDPQRSGYFYGVFRARPRAEVKLKVGDCLGEFVVEELNEVASDCERAKSYYVEASEEVIPLSFVVGSYVLKLPKIKIEEAEYSDGKVLLKLRNLGDDADDVVVLIYVPGKPLARTSLGKLPSGDEREVELKVEASKGVTGAIARVIWVKGKMTEVAAEKFVSFQAL